MKKKQKKQKTEQDKCCNNKQLPAATTSSTTGTTTTMYNRRSQNRRDTHTHKRKTHRDTDREQNRTEQSEAGNISVAKKKKKKKGAKMEERKISRIGEIQGILGKSPELGEKFNGFPRNRVVVGSENWGKQARGGGGGIQRSMAVVLAVPAKKGNGNLGACLIMATDMAQI